MNLIPAALPWQSDLWQKTCRSFEQQRMPHAALYVGPKGVGKRQFATAMAAYILCENKQQQACGQCRSCLQIAAGHHPNIMHLTRELDEKTGKRKRDISIQSVRVLTEHLTLTSHYGQAKVALIDPADALNQSSANALLKTIEEPPQNAYLILISEQPQTLMATLRSRCQSVRFDAPDAAIALQWLGGEADARMALDECHGAPLAAQELIASGTLNKLREWQSSLGHIAKGSLDPLQFAASFATSKTNLKEEASEFLRWFLSWLSRELQHRILHDQASSAIALGSVMQEAIEAQKRLLANGMPQLVLESLLVNWWRLNKQTQNA